MAYPDRYLDLLKQGFMNRRTERTLKKQPVIVACDRCRDWHWEGKHIKGKS